MKRILFFILLLSSIVAKAQTDDSNKYIYYRYQYGTRSVRGDFDSVFKIPFIDTTIHPNRPGGLTMRTQDSLVYYWNGIKWSLFAGGSTPTLQQVNLTGNTTDVGMYSTADVGLNVTGSGDGTRAQIGKLLDNGFLRLGNSATYTGTVKADNLSHFITYQLPDNGNSLDTIATLHNIRALGGGLGNPNSNIGSQFRLAVPGTNNIKTVAGGSYINLDSTSNSNAITFKLDTANLNPLYQPAGTYSFVPAEGLLAVDGGSNLDTLVVDPDYIATVQRLADTASALRALIGSGGGGGTTTNAVTFNNGGSGDASGATFNGSAAKTISYNTIGAEASFTETVEEFTSSTTMSVTVSNSPKSGKVKMAYLNGVLIKASNISWSGTTATLSGFTRESSDVITVKYSY